MSLTKLPAHEVVYRRLRDMILYGELAPGQAVTIQGLVAQLDAGMTPVREAIRRLTAEGALSFQGNRRVSVPFLTLQDLDQLAFARLAIEPQLAERAAPLVSDAALERMHAHDQALNRAIAEGDVRQYLRQNHLFHMTIYGAADAPVLVGLVEGLWLRMGPSLRGVCGRVGTANLPDRHEEALHALWDGDGPGAAAALRADIEQGIAQVRSVLSERDF